jgi:hypothetical protein
MNTARASIFAIPSDPLQVVDMLVRIQNELMLNSALNRIPGCDKTLSERSAVHGANNNESC